MTPRPSDGHRRAIVLPVDNEQPYFVWIATSGDDTDEEETEGVEHAQSEEGDEQGGDEVVGQSTETTADPDEPQIDEGDQDSDVDSEISDAADDEDIVHDLGVPAFHRPDVQEATPEFGTLLGEEEEAVGILLLVVGKMGCGEHLDHSIYVCYKDDFGGEPRNMCADKLMRGEAGRFWRDR